MPSPMALKVKLTRPELKRQREALVRYERYLPMLKLKQQQLQLAILKVQQERARAQREMDRSREQFERYEAVLRDRAGLDVPALARPAGVHTRTVNVAGVNMPVLESVEFEPIDYSLFATPAWVDRALADLRDLERRRAGLEILQRQHRLLGAELSKVVQRVNLFEKVMIPRSSEIIRVIRIYLGDQMTAAVGRAKIAKSKLKEAGPYSGQAATDVPEAPTP